MPDQIKVRTQNKQVPWSPNKRFKIGDTCVHQGFNYTNITGKNSEPGSGSDWFELPTKSEAARNEIIIKEKSQLIGPLQGDVAYVLDGFFTLDEGEFINCPAENISIYGFGFDVSGVVKSVAGESIFKSVDGGSKNLILKDTTYISGDGDVFDLVDVDGTHAIEYNDINFAGCSSLGKIDGYRQFTGTTLGFYGCDDGLLLDGSWNGFKLTNTNAFGFGASGTLFKKGPNLDFSNRFYVSLNIDFPTGSKLCDFVEGNFNDNDLFQINATTAKVNGVIGDENASTLVPNITANNPRSLWSNNVGLPDTAAEKFSDDDIEGTYDVDWFKDTFNLQMTGDVDLIDKNLPASGKSTKEIQIYLSDHPDNEVEAVPTFPAAWNLNKVGTYKPGEVNKITLKFIKTGVYFMKIDNSLTVYPAPDIQSLEPTSLLPNSTKELIIKGSFFTPATVVKIEGSTVQSQKFINSGQIELSVQTPLDEGNYDISITNGTLVLFDGILPIVLGTVYIPTQPEWGDITGSLDVSQLGAAKLDVYNEVSTGVWGTQIFDISKDFRVAFNFKFSPLGAPSGVYRGHTLQLLDVVDESMQYSIAFQGGTGGKIFNTWNPTDSWINGGGVFINNKVSDIDLVIEWLDGALYLYINNSLNKTYTHVFANNLKLKVNLKINDVVNIKYIELDSQS
tara:strand:- start:2605 stop:4632 length:2028 start_codon:yes stop_codon:yes gene_type:complete